jgi:hypothetical protein
LLIIPNQDVKSLNSHWQNVYFHEDSSIDSKNTFLFIYFMKIVDKTLENRIQILKSQSFCKNADLVPIIDSFEKLKNNSFQLLNTVDSFFEGSRFKGKNFLTVYF